MLYSPYRVFSYKQTYLLNIEAQGMMLDSEVADVLYRHNHSEVPFSQ